jgi:hypothetical protein
MDVQSGNQSREDGGIFFLSSSFSASGLKFKADGGATILMNTEQVESKEKQHDITSKDS